MREILGLLGAETNAAKQFGDTVRAFRRIADAVNFQGFADDFSHADTGVQGGKRILKHDLHLPPQRPEIGLAESSDILST